MLPCPQEKPAQAALPQEWQDDERMAFLFSAFKQNREVNCSDWDSKMAFWLPLVVNQNRRKGQLRFTLKELQESFQRKGSTPLGLGTVIEELVRQKKLQRESEFVASINSGWISWGMGLFLVKPLKWTLSAMLGWNKIPASEVYVVTELLKEKADSAYCLFQNSFPSSQSMVSVSELHSLCASLCPDERMFYLVLLQLQKEKRITVLERNGEKIVKFAQGAEDAVSPVNDVDLGVYQLKQSEKLLHEKVEMLSVQAERSKAEAQSAYRAGKKQLALRSLKSKKRLDKRIGELQSKLECVQSILDRIASSQTDRMVVDAYQAGVGALKLSMKDITVQKAEDLMEQIQEYCDVQDDVSQTLAGADFSGLDVDTEELENELDSLLRDSTYISSERRRSSRLSFFSDLPGVDTEKLENELDSLLRDSTNKPSELPDVPQTELLPPAIAQGAQRKPNLTREGLMLRPGSILSEPRQVRKPVAE